MALTIAGFLLIPVTPATAAGPAGPPKLTAAAPLSKALRADGVLRHLNGSFDARGYRMVLGRNGAPRFVKAAAPATGDNLWSDKFGLPGLPGSTGIGAVAVSGSTIYVGGRFTTLSDGLVANGVAMWNGRGWYALGTGITGGNTTVYALAVSGSNLYVGGNFTAAGGVAASNVARWNGSTWSALGAGTSGTVYALALNSTTLYAGGNFATAGGTTVNSIAAWTIASGTWSALGSGIQSCIFQGGVCKLPSPATVKALLLNGSTLYVGGYFNGAGGTEELSLATWNATTSTWGGVGGNAVLLSSQYGTVDALARNGSALYIGGEFTSVGATVTNGTVVNPGTAAKSVAEWTGSAWTALGTGADCSCTPTVTAVGFSGGKLYMSGNFTGAGGDGTPNLAVWNGSAWSPTNPNLTGPPSAFAPFGTSAIIAVGSFANAGGVSGPLLNGIGLWNGVSWSGYGLGVGNGTTGGGSVHALAAYNHTLWASGSFAWAGSTPALDLAMFNGTKWTAHQMSGTDVAAIVISGGKVYVGGAFTAIDGVSLANVAVWNGSSWSGLGTGIGGGVQSLLIFHGKLWAGGTFSTAGGNSASHVAVWDLTNHTWSSLGANLTFDGGVVALAGWTVSSTDYRIVMGGSFYSLTDSIGDYAVVNSLVAYDPFVSVATNPFADYYDFPGANNTVGVYDGYPGNGYVSALLLVGQTLYVGGQFTQVGDVPASGLATCTLNVQAGTCWAAPGQLTSATSTAPSVNALTQVGSSIYLAGYFNSVGGVSASDIARYTPGTGFAALGSGIGGSSGASASALAQSADGLYVGGNFTLTGAGTHSASLGLWTQTAFPLTITEAVSPTSDTVGNPLKFTSTVTNKATTSSNSVTVKTSIPANTSLVSVTPSQGTCSVSGTAVTCSVGIIAAGGTANVALVVTPAVAGKVSDTATVSETGSPYSNSASATATVS